VGKEEVGLVELDGGGRGVLVQVVDLGFEEERVEVED